MGFSISPRGATETSLPQYPAGSLVTASGILGGVDNPLVHRVIRYICQNSFQGACRCSTDEQSITYYSEVIVEKGARCLFTLAEEKLFKVIRRNKNSVDFLVDNRYQEKGSVILKNSRHCLIIYYRIDDKEMIFVSIRELRECTGLSQNKFAAMFGIPAATVKDWEYGRRNPPSYVVDMIKTILEYKGIIVDGNYVDECEKRRKSVERALAIVLTATKGPDEEFMNALELYISGKLTLSEIEKKVNRLEYIGA